MTDIAKLMDESEATDYYYNTYLPEFDSDLYGEPVSLEEFIANEWRDIRRGL